MIFMGFFYSLLFIVYFLWFFYFIVFKFGWQQGHLHDDK
jgi:hypothetical protein